MQTLGLSDSTPRTQGRISALLWPTIRNAGDYDYITEQGLWVCFFIAGVLLVGGALNGSVLAASIDALFYVLAGLGIRQRSRSASLVAFFCYVLMQVVILRTPSGRIGWINFVLIALLLANIRGVWLSANWKKASSPEHEYIPVRLNATFVDMVTDQLPRVLWPKMRLVFYALGALEVLAILTILFSGVRHSF